MSDPVKTIEPPAPNDIQLPRTEKYLRNRPFLVINVIHRPSKGVNTAVKGWASEPGAMAAFEQPSVVDRVNNTHIRNANVIIDVINAKCVKNPYTGVSPDEVVNHYLEKYRPQVTEAMDIWLTNVARKKIAETKNAVYTLSQ